MSDYGTPPPPPPPPAAGGYHPAGMGGTPPPNYLVWAILSTVFCCLPLGVVSIVFAAQVNGKWASGDVNGALDSSKKAKNFAMWSAIAGVVGIILYVVFLGGIAFLSSNSTSP